MVDDFHRLGWVRFPFDQAVTDWAAHAVIDGRRAVDDPDMAHWHVCEGTWFVGVDALLNDTAGRVGGSEVLSGRAVDFLRDDLGGWPALHRAQVSVIYPGYPRPRDGESAGAFRYRQMRDAAHVDGLKPVGPNRRRHPQEFHAFILGLPLTDVGPDAAPMVVWEGSHEVIRAGLREVLDNHDPKDWHTVDVTDAYQEARRTVFETCTRVPLPARPGEAYAVHRLALHGVAPWKPGSKGRPDGRMIAYFRPEMADRQDWLISP
ncbi:hypothetical protein [Falsiphaeobacter marinintestinus]|uniref:hypothetical protein n=1 Tax=Falsiphaeobacter marinintestinus TaxID=1492905 RepID=UPI0011B4355F|nr:hypothetical protein [Phaeobacter marinintestinus]